MTITFGGGGARKTKITGKIHEFDARIERESAMQARKKTVSANRFALTARKAGRGFRAAKIRARTGIVKALAKQLDAQVVTDSGPKGTMVFVTPATFAKAAVLA